MAKFKVEKRIGRMTFEGTSYDGLEVVTNLDISFKLLMEIQRLASSEDNKKILEANNLWCTEVLRSWNLTDENDKDIPATMEGALEEVPAQLLAVIISKWAEHVVEPEANLEKPQNDIATLETLVSHSQSN